MTYRKYAPKCASCGKGITPVEVIIKSTFADDMTGQFLIYILFYFRVLRKLYELYQWIKISTLIALFARSIFFKLISLK